jgi:hypothetical protein
MQIAAERFRELSRIVRKRNHAHASSGIVAGNCM